MKLPVLFIGHGSPLNAIRDSAYTEEWQNYGDELLDEAKLGIFVGSLVSGIVGYFFLKHQLPERD